MIKSLKSSGEKVTAKQWAAEMIHGDLVIVTGYYFERYDCIFDLMTEKEKNEVDKQIQKYHDRIQKILSKSMRKK